MLSFTNNINYKLAYVELLGALLGSYIAVYGALWVRRKINEKEKINIQKKQACVIYYDLDFAFKDLIEIFDDTKRKYRIERIISEDEVVMFCSTALGRKLHLNPNWVVDVSKLADVLSSHEIRLVYECYGKLSNIDRTMQTENIDKVKELYVHDICWLINGNEKVVHSDIKILLDKLSLMI